MYSHSNCKNYYSMCDSASFSLKRQNKEFIMTTLLCSWFIIAVTNVLKSSEIIQSVVFWCVRTSVATMLARI